MNNRKTIFPIGYGYPYAKSLLLGVAVIVLMAPSLLFAQAVAIVVENEAIEPTQRAAEDLNRILGIALGPNQSVTLTHDAAAAAKAESRIWVGRHAQLSDIFKGVDLNTPGEEEILIVVRGSDVAILGHDKVFGKLIQQAGTSLAVYTFMQRQLGVRWFWPGDLGEHVPSLTSLKLADEVFRYTPQIHGRDLRLFPVSRFLPRSTPNNDPRLIQAKAWDAQVTTWSIRNRAQDSFRMAAGHAFNDWVANYQKDHPEYFALQPDGTRTPYPSPRNVKLCISNPAVAEQWLDNAVAYLTRNPAADMVSASPNDSGYSGYCTCENCKAWDAKDGTPITLTWKDSSIQAPALTDRYVHFWNRLAQGLRERVTDRPIYIGVWAYTAMRTPPLHIKPDPNIRVGFVGGLSWDANASHEKDLKSWTQWSDQVRGMVWRPNLFHYGWTMPGTMARGMSKDFKFLADHGLIGIDIDSIFNDYATRGLDYYTLIQLAWDPHQDIDQLINDYCQTAYGPAAAPTMVAYFDTLEKSHNELREKRTGMHRTAMVDVDLEHFGKGFLNELMTVLETAQTKANADTNTTDKQKQRVAFMRQGLTFAQAQMEVVDVMAKLRTGEGDRLQLLPQAVKKLARRDTLGNAASEVYAIGYQQFLQQSSTRKMNSQFGPVTAQDEALLETDSILLLPGRWDFQTDPQKVGNKSGWHTNGFDSSQWQKISVFSVWGPQLVPDGPVDLDNPVDPTYNGDAWYRTRFDAPPLKDGQQLWLELPAVDKSMTLHVNGKELARQTYDPKVDPDAWTKPRRFDLTNAITKGTNLIAIKVTSEYGAGGIFGGAFLRVLEPNLIAAPRPADTQDQWTVPSEQPVDITLVPGYFVGTQAMRIQNQGVAQLLYNDPTSLEPGTYELTLRLRTQTDPALGDVKNAIVFRISFVYRDANEYDRAWIRPSNIEGWQTHLATVVIKEPVRLSLVKAFITVKGVYDIDELALRRQK